MFTKQGKGQGCHNGFGNRASQGRGLRRGLINNHNETDTQVISFGRKDGSGMGNGCGRRANKNSAACQGNGKGMGLGAGRGKAHNRIFNNGN